MRKLIGIIIAFTFIFSLAGCGSGGTQTSSASAADRSEAVSAQSDNNGTVEQPSAVGSAVSDAASENSDETSESTEGTSGGGADNDASGGVLIAYFSHTGNTKVIAGQIHEAVGGDLIQIVPVNAYPESYNECVDVARAELDAQARPEIETIVDNMDSYDVIYLGYPNWWGTIPMPVATFVEAYDLSGKTIIPFCTHDGTALGRSVEDIAAICTDSTIAKGLAIRGRSVNNAEADVSAWISEVHPQE